METQSNAPLLGEGILYLRFNPEDTIFRKRSPEKRSEIPKIGDIPKGIDAIAIVTRRLTLDGIVEVEYHTPHIPIGTIFTYDELKAQQPELEDNKTKLFISTISGKNYPIKEDYCEGKDYFIR